MKTIAMTWKITLVTMLAALGACAPIDGANGDGANDDGHAIVGGSEAKDFPEAVLVDMSKGGKPAGVCSGTVIAPKVVLTAAHCLVGYDGFDVTAPFAAGQTAKSSKGLVLDYDTTSKYVDPKHHDVGVIVLDSAINLTSYPELGASKVQDGTKVLNIGRVKDGQRSDTALFVSAPIQVEDASRMGFALDYKAVGTIEKGDGGGADVLVGSHTIVAVNSGLGGGVEVLARVDLVADWLRKQIDANGGPGGTTSSGGGEGGSGGGGAGGAGTTSSTTTSSTTTSSTTTSSTTTSTSSGGGPTTSFAQDVEPIFSTKCGGCHTGGTALGGLDLSPGKAYKALVGSTSKGCSSHTLVTAGNPGKSYLVDKVKGAASICGSKMPLGGALLDTEIKTLSDWIAEGAIDNG